MKKLLLLTFLFSGFSFSSLNANTYRLQIQNNNCANYAWNAASDFCAKRDQGCTDYEYWAMTDTAYRICSSLKLNPSLTP
ncbi:hypothetical protein [Mesonia aestuariivivens]|uniref:Uncharacterized protein n=1 Tax=Mesonia aestuariivivens TaxID=2796128 RepID=A0ABS6W186_9FLAO|nr:hypothetical protein [Mesonia aestuariivivens]MBW2961584.1 hypothetical protein [Mesonia aestuariivivens]